MQDLREVYFKRLGLGEAYDSKTARVRESHFRIYNYPSSLTLDFRRDEQCDHFRSCVWFVQRTLAEDRRCSCFNRGAGNRLP